MLIALDGNKHCVFSYMGIPALIASYTNDVKECNAIWADYDKHIKLTLQTSKTTSVDGMQQDLT
eukprot:858569-Ditylum_brightwellii.AAC.1